MGKTSNKTEISVIIPVTALVYESVLYRVETIQRALSNVYKNVNVVIVEQSMDGKRYFDKILGVDYYCIEYPVFNKPWCINYGVDKTTGDYVVVADSDMFSFDAYLGRLLDWMREGKRLWAFGWNRLVYTDKDQRQEILGGRRLNGLACETPRPGLSEGGYVCFNREFFYRIGCCNESFEELGGPDNELITRAKYIYNEYEMYPAMVYHLWHPQKRKSLRPTRKTNVQKLRYTQRQTKDVIKWLNSCKQGMAKGPLISRRKFME